jgi:hypothetical protein
MTRAEFRKRLDQLRQVITRGLSCYAAWTNVLLHYEGKISWSLEEHTRVLDRFQGFFGPVGFALRHMALIEFNKVFDADGKAVSLWNLLGAARRDTSLVPGRTSAEVDAVSRQFRNSRKILTALKQMRDQRLAHMDANPAPVDSILKSDFDHLVERVVSAFNWLSTAHDGRVINWDHSVQKVERHTTDVLAILREEVERKQREYREEMARIVLEEVRRRETVVGRPLDEEEMRSLKRSFGLAEEEMHRLQQERGVS